MSAQSNVYISLEFTPNPNTLKYSVNRQLLEKGAANFTQKEEAQRYSPLANKLLEIPDVCGVMIGKDFVTITKSEDGNWDEVHKNSISIMESHFKNNEPIFTAFTPNKENLKGGTSEVESKIREILDQEIRPAVAMDGGDITFEKYENGTVYLYLQGSCSGCPSSTATLKMGIETRLRQAIPEIQEVVSI